MARILIVDDERSIRFTLTEFLRRDGHEVESAEDVASALTVLRSGAWDVLVTDIVMPGVSGVDLLRQARQLVPEVQVIVMTGEPTVETASEAVRAGANDYLVKPISKSAIQRAVGNAVKIKGLSDEKRHLETLNRQYQQGLEQLVETRTKTLKARDGLLQSLFAAAPVGIGIMEDHRLTVANDELCRMLGYTAGELTGQPCTILFADAAECRKIGEAAESFAEGGVLSIETRWRTKAGAQREIFLRCAPIQLERGGQAITLTALDITERKEAEHQIEEGARKLQEMMDGSIRAISAALEMRDPYTAGHERRVADLAYAMGVELGLPAHQNEGIRIAGYLHDIGKIAVPTEILNKPGRLNPYELGIIKSHPQVGYDILVQISFVWPVAQATMQHHERLDGSGYPGGIKDELIIPEARILAVADVVEAMSSHRPYRPALGRDAALAEVRQKRGTLYDAQAVDACIRVVEAAPTKYL